VKKIVFILLLLSALLRAQPVQTVKGKVVDAVTGIGIPGVIVQVKGNGAVAPSSTDNNGFYRLIGVPVGRQSFGASYPGYKPSQLSDIIVTSGKEVVLTIELEESALEVEEVSVSASGDSDVVNTMQGVNMKTFSIEETERYPGSRQDPARMAQNFAGVQGTNDSRNDIVVRGNSPAGLLWRLEEIDIPNPNHFAIAGSAGGPQGIINNKYLANSEFYTGAFPAQYGNALGGVFDLKMRNGNNEKHERTFQLGILGTELSLEGPLSKRSGASYLATYRYSTLALFGSVNFKLGTSAIPRYQDLGLRLNFPTAKAGVFSLSGIAGSSDIAIILSDVKERPKELYGDQNRDQYFGSDMGVGILSHVIQAGKKSLMKTSLAYSGQRISSSHFQVLRDRDFVPNDTLPQVLGYSFTEKKATLSWFIRTKINASNSFRAGVFANAFFVTYSDSIKFNSLYDTLAGKMLGKPFKGRMDVEDQYNLLQPYVSFVHKFSDRLSLNLGVIAQYLTLNGHSTIEPRASLRYQASRRHLVSVAAGIHSQMQSSYLYYTAPDSIVREGLVLANTAKELTNKDLDFSKSRHLVVGHDFAAMQWLRIRTEVYYQQLYDIPVYEVPSGVSAINRGAGFTRFFPLYTMVNSGTGTNYGLELTVERTFHRHYFVLFSGSLFESRYTGSNGRTYDTDFNGNYVLNVLSGLEYHVGRAKKNVLSLGGKFTYGGGKRYSPVNRAASDAIMDIVPVDDKINTLRFPDYNRVDLRIAYKINGRRVATEIALDLINILSTRNVLALTYSPDPADRTADPWVRNYQLGFLPLFYVKVDF
jgi:hypothetical protein